mmetsp:Transcript_63323/g.137788  ORF Transcript_63323/g.137788 Transcript_63323/m.137788 type:complete len:326 (+) Transcript_63323:56-1033(+)
MVLVCRGHFSGAYSRSWSRVGTLRLLVAAVLVVWSYRYCGHVASRVVQSAAFTALDRPREAGIAFGPELPPLHKVPFHGFLGEVRKATRAARSLGGVLRRNALTQLRAFGDARSFCGSAGRQAVQHLRERLPPPLNRGNRQMVATRPLQVLPPLFARRSVDEVGVSSAPADFFLFIKDYAWSLRFRVMRVAESLAPEPLQLHWVRLRKPFRDPKGVLLESSEEHFQWDVLAPPRHKGFKYQITRAVGNGVVAALNFLEDRGLSLLVRPDEGISLLDANSPDKDSNGAGLRVTHCWVQCRGMPVVPIVQSISFYDVRDVVLQWQKA